MKHAESEFGAQLPGLRRRSVTGGPRDLAANKKHLLGYGSWKP